MRKQELIEKLNQMVLLCVEVPHTYGLLAKTLHRIRNLGQLLDTLEASTEVDKTVRYKS